MKPLKLTSRELNKAYSKVNEISKTGIDKTLPVFVWVDDKQLEFMFDSYVGPKGAWIISSDFELDIVDDEDDFPKEDPLNQDWDYQL